MSALLFLCHRMPFPPDKGDKIRAWHVLSHLARSHDVHLGCLVDDPADWQHEGALREVCASVGAFGMDRRWSTLRALASVRPGRPLSLGFFDSPALHRWVQATVQRERITRAFVFSSAMAPYAPPAIAAESVLDMVDVDSEKWSAYASGSAWPLSLVHAREGRTLLAFERQAAARFGRTLLVSPAECARLAALGPELARRLGALENGVDLAFFKPGAGGRSPYAAGSVPLVFTGTMDYRPNAEAVLWFAREVFPALRDREPAACFAVVGARPAAEIRRLAAQPGIVVTGRVADTRPYLAHAAAVVAPLGIARGVQNKVLEAMAMARPVIVSAAAHEGLRATPGRDLLVADGAAATIDAVMAVLDGRHPGLGDAARRYAERWHDWAETLRPLDAMFGAPAEAVAVPA